MTSKIRPWVRKFEFTKFTERWEVKSENVVLVALIKLIHSAAPQARPIVIIVFTHIVRPSTLSKSNKTKQVSTENNVVHYWRDCESDLVDHWWSYQFSSILGYLWFVNLVAAFINRYVQTAIATIEFKQCKHLWTKCLEGILALLTLWTKFIVL